MENQLVHDVLLALGTKCLIYRCNVIVAGRLRSLPNGHADVLACVGGRYVAIELKSPSGRQSEQQKNYQAAVERSGGIYILARSVQDVLDRLPPSASG